MSKTKSTLLDKRIVQFFESTTELLTDIHARNKAGNKSVNKGAANKKRKKQKTISIAKKGKAAKK
jgi:hypothetical protein